MNEFIVESKGHCFLCLNKISNNLGQFSFQNSLHYLARYLQLDMRRVFFDGGNDISSKLLNKVQRSNLKVELCDGCSKLSNSFSATYRQLEKFQIEVRSKLDLIHQKMLNGREHNNDSRELSIKLANTYKGPGTNAELLAKLEITDVLRNEAMEKCSLMMNKAKPRVKVQKLTSDELIRNTKMKPKYEDKQLSNPELELETHPQIKTETIPSNSDVFSELDYDTSFTGYDNEEPDYEPTHMPVSPEAEEKFSWTESRPNVKIKTPQHGRHQCDKCDKYFTRQTSLRRHLLASHFGQRFPCNKCTAKFTERDKLKRHEMSIHLGKRFRCQFCSKTFSQAAGRNFHMKNKCHWSS